MKRLPLILALALLSASALAVQPNEMLADPKLETRARVISRDLRCLVCQNQSIDDSDAPLAHDLRVLLRERLTAGDTDEQARQFLVDRYGDYVLLRPPFKSTTLTLWLGPPALLLAGLAIAWNAARRRRPKDATPLTDEEKAKLDKLLS